MLEDICDKLHAGIDPGSLTCTEGDSGPTITAVFRVWHCKSELTLPADNIYTYPTTAKLHPCIPLSGSPYAGYQYTGFNPEDPGNTTAVVVTVPHPTCDLNNDSIFVSNIEVSDLKDFMALQILPEDFDTEKQETCCGYDITVTWSPGEDGNSPPNACTIEQYIPFPKIGSKFRNALTKRAPFCGVLVTNSGDEENQCEGTTSPFSVTLPEGETQVNSTTTVATCADGNCCLSGQIAWSNINDDNATVRIVVGGQTVFSQSYSAANPLSDFSFCFSSDDTGTSLVGIVLNGTVTAGGSVTVDFYGEAGFGTDIDVTCAPGVDCCADDPADYSAAVPLNTCGIITGIGACIPIVNSAGTLLELEEEVLYSVIQYPIRVAITGTIDLTYPQSQVGRCNATAISITTTTPNNDCVITYAFAAGTLLVRPSHPIFHRDTCRGLSVCWLEATIEFDYCRDGWKNAIDNYGYHSLALPGETDSQNNMIPTGTEYEGSFKGKATKRIKMVDINGQPLKRYLDERGQPLPEGSYSQIIYGKCTTDFTNTALWYGAASVAAPAPAYPFLYLQAF